MSELYSCRAQDATHYVISKFTEDLDVLASYTLSIHGCECKAGHRTTCRHREMLVLFRTTGHVDDGWMMDWHTRLWWSPESQGDVRAAVEEIAEQCGAVAEVGTLPAPRSAPDSAQDVQQACSPAARSGPDGQVERGLPPSGSGFKRRFG